MSTLHHLRYKEIYLFKSEQNQFAPNALKCFIYFLRSQGKKGILDFAFSSSSDSIHAKLSIKDNLILESVTAGLIRNCDTNLIDKINNLENEHLAQLIHTLGPLDVKVEDLPPAGIKLTSIVKALLATTEYIFLEKPDQDLNSEQINLVKKCLEYEAKTQGRKIFIRATNLEIWVDIATDIVESDHGQNYKKQRNPFYNEQKTTISKAAPNLSLIKKAS